MDRIPLVSVFCPTYNHEKYIRQCLEGFVMQQTNFQIEVIVQDDASTDGTSKIVKEFAEKYSFIIPRIHEVNIYSQGKDLNEYFYNNARGKYIAMCEGDDYWTNPLKLQKQVDFLEANEEYGMVYTRAKVFNQKKQTFLKRINGEEYINYEGLLQKNTIPTLTSLFRRDILIGYYKAVGDNLYKWKIGDYPLWLYISKVKNIHFISNVTGTYRLNEESASQTKSHTKKLEYLESIFNVQEYFSLLHCVDKIVYNKITNNYFRRAIYSAIITKNNYLVSKIKSYMKTQKLYFSFIIVILIQLINTDSLINQFCAKILNMLWKRKI